MIIETNGWADEIVLAPDEETARIHAKARSSRFAAACEPGDLADMPIPAQCRSVIVISSGADKLAAATLSALAARGIAVLFHHI